MYRTSGIQVIKPIIILLTDASRFRRDRLVQAHNRFNDEDIRRFIHGCPMKKKTKGFTLIELMIVIVIVGVLATISISMMLGMREKGYIKALESDLNRAYKAALVFHTDYPQDEIDITALKDYGFTASPKIQVAVSNGTAEGLLITAAHPSVHGVYRVNHNGDIAKQ